MAFCFISGRFTSSRILCSYHKKETVGEKELQQGSSKGWRRSVLACYAKTFGDRGGWIICTYEKRAIFQAEHTLLSFTTGVMCKTGSGRARVPQAGRPPGLGYAGKAIFVPGELNG